MKQPLPSRPNLDQLKKQAKDLHKLHQSGDSEGIRRIRENHPQFTGEADAAIRAAEFTLTDAQLVVAREYGFDSWPKLKTHVEAVLRGDDPQIAAFLMAAVNGKQQEAKNLLAEQPSIAKANIYTAAMLGEAEVVQSMLKREATWATRKGGPKNWEPLLYLGASRFHQEDAKHAAGIMAVAKTLLANGADPDTFFLWEGDGKAKQSALYLATCEANHPALARVLLEAGASPNDGESIYHAAERYHLDCLELLAEFGVNVSDRIQPWNNTPLYFILGHKPTKGNARQVVEGVRWLLEHGADPNVSAYEFKGRPIHLVASNGWGVDVLELLWKRGADLNARRKDGKTAYALAARYGHTHVKDWLREHGAQSELTPVEEFFAACGHGEESAVRAMLAARPELIESLSDEEKAALAFAAGDGKVEAVRLMLLAGLPLTVPGDTGGTPLHQAAWYGQLEVGRFLITRGALLEAKDATHGVTPLDWACHGSDNCRNPNGDYPGFVEVLIQAGAKLPPEAGGTDEVKAVLHRHGVRD